MGMLLRGKLLELRQCNTKVVVGRSESQLASSIAAASPCYLAARFCRRNAITLVSESAVAFGSYSI